MLCFFFSFFEKLIDYHVVYVIWTFCFCILYTEKKIYYTTLTHLFLHKNWRKQSTARPTTYDVTSFISFNQLLTYTILFFKQYITIICTIQFFNEFWFTFALIVTYFVIFFSRVIKKGFVDHRIKKMGPNKNNNLLKRKQEIRKIKYDRCRLGYKTLGKLYLLILIILKCRHTE